jgi:hypothetical protein
MHLAHDVSEERHSNGLRYDGLFHTILQSVGTIANIGTLADASGSFGDFISGQ